MTTMVILFCILGTSGIAVFRVASYYYYYYHRKLIPRITLFGSGGQSRIVKDPKRGFFLGKLNNDVALQQTTDSGQKVHLPS